MEGNQQLPPKIEQWLLDRGISKKIIETYLISYDGERIVIPLFDEEGNFLFNKYRRNPFQEDGAKYIYDKGASSVLYGFRPATHKTSEYLLWADEIFLCEGELDALALMSKNEDVHAYSTTGGCGTFDPTWISSHIQKVYICYDYDKAGIKGALNLNAILPNSKIIWLPKEGMDLTDFFVAGNSYEDFLELKENAESYEYPVFPPEEFKYKKQFDELIKYQKAKADDYLKVKRSLGQKRKNTLHIEVLIQMWLSEAEKTEGRKKILNKPTKAQIENEVQRAKTVDIRTLIPFNHQGFAKCIFHNEKTASMKYYKDNTFHCFGCNKNGDAIDIVMKRDGLSFREALKKLCND